jgi:hypothetical protein
MVWLEGPFLGQETQIRTVLWRESQRSSVTIPCDEQLPVVHDVVDDPFLVFWWRILRHDQQFSGRNILQVSVLVELRDSPTYL